ncbi:MAG: DUF6513 domain-containing protein [Planctomycetota bacterium]|nr:DUF6513 domain-containing protein [Planctomycetota bacterium]
MTPPPRVALITGKLAEPALRRVAEGIARAGKVEPHVIALNIQVAALLTAEWVGRKLTLPPGQPFARVILPGYCRGDVAPLSAQFGLPVEIGPRDMHDLPEYLGGKRPAHAEPLTAHLTAHSIEIIAEINHAPRLPLAEILAQADALRRDGADMIDVGCDPQADRPAWTGLAEVVRALRDAGHRVSVDTFHPAEAAAGAKAGAELILSVSSANAEAAADWGVPVVAVPDTPQDLDSLDRTIATLERLKVPHRLDPIIEPLGLGFAASLGRYLEVRRRHPQAAMMMGVGNLTEMTAADSAGVNALLIGFCQELDIRSVLTTQVVNWARSSVREIDLARRLMHRAVADRMPPKRIDDSLVSLRDPRLRPLTREELDGLAKGLTDRNIRLFAGPDGKIHVMNKDFHLTGEDPFVLFDQTGIDDASHAFYLGYEMAKAVTALTLGKNYTQDQALRWGWLTREEISHHERRKGAK